MKTSLLLVVLLGTVALGCSPSKPALRVDRVTESYRYMFSASTDAYERPGFDSKRLGAFTTTDTVSTMRRLTTTSGWLAVEFRGRTVWVNNPAIHSIDTETISSAPAPSHGLRRAVYHSLSDGWGLGIGGGSERALTLEALYKHNRHMFRLSYAHQFSGQLGQNKGTQLGNYGRTVVGNSTYFSAVGAGYDFWLNMVSTATWAISTPFPTIPISAFQQGATTWSPAPRAPPGMAAG